MNIDEINQIVNLHQKSIVGEDRKIRINESLKNKQIEILWDLAFRSHSDSRVPVKCLIDNEYSTYSTTNLVKGNISCDHCLTNKYRKLFLDKGFKYLHKAPTKGITYVTGECLTCKTNTVAASLNLFSKYNITCSFCEHKRITDALEVKGCEYVSEKFVKYIRRITYKNTEGELFENSQSSIVRGSFTSGGSHWKQRHYLYLIVCNYNDETYFKIGTANNPESRLKNLNLLGDTLVTTLESFDTRYDASKQEKHLHRIFKKFNLDKTVAELFTTGLSKLGKKAGVTEWFSKDILPELQELYK